MDLRRIAVVTPGSFVIPSERSSSVERVIEQVVSLAQHEVRPVIYGITGKGLPLKGEIDGVPCIRLPPGASYLPSLIRRLRQSMPDIIEVNNRPLTAQKIRATLPSDVKIVLNLHSTTFIRPPYLKPFQLEAILNMMDGVIVNSHYLKEYIDSECHTIQPKFLVNHLGVRLEHFVPRYSPAAEALRLARLEHYGWSDRKILIFAGRLIPEKGIHHIIDAIPDIIAKHPEVLLLIIGSASYGSDRETPYVRRLKKMAEPLGKWIVFQPYIPHSSLASWYTMADIVIVPSADREAFGLVNVEAMASGVPIIATNAGGIPEVIEDGVNGYLIPLDALPTGLSEPINRLLDDETLRRRIGISGRERARLHYRWEMTARRWSRFMQNI